MPYSIWSRGLVFLTVLGAILTFATWLGRPARMVLLGVLTLVAVQAIPVYLLFLCSQARHRRRLMDSIESAGGRITARLAVDPQYILGLDLSACKLSQIPWDSLHVLRELETLNLSHTRLTNAHLEALSRLPMLKHLDLEGTAITDEGLLFLADFPELRTLSLSDTFVTEDGLNDLAACVPNLDVQAEHLPEWNPLNLDKDLAYDVRV